MDHRTAHVVTNPVLIDHRLDQLTLAVRVVAYTWSAESGYIIEAVLDTKQWFRHEDSHWRIALREATPLHP